MVDRRQIVTGSVLGGVLGALGGEPVEAAPQSGGGDPDLQRGFNNLAGAIDRLRQSVEAQRDFPEIRAIRDIQKTYLRTNNKVPDFIDVGVDVWYNVHDWHVRWQQPMTFGRDASGRLTLYLSGTTVIMRTDVENRFVGLPYDSR